MAESKIKKTYRNICSIESTNQRVDNLAHRLEELEKKIDVAQRNTYDLVYANLFHDTIKNSKWFDAPLSLGGWAIGYNFAYILYKILDEIQPKHILELGLGQSTKIINAYAKHFKGIEHHIVEHDPSWIDFFKKNTDMSKMSNIHLLDSYKKTYKGTKLNAYKDFAKEFKGQKFDLIAIDGPVGSGQEYSRMDVLDILPDCLPKQFIILLDDCNRIGEQRTIKVLEEKLSSHNVKFKSSRYYKGRTDLYICVSEDLEFLCHI